MSRKQRRKRQVKNDYLPIPGWMANYAVLNEVDLSKVLADEVWLRGEYKQLRSELEVGLHLFTTLIDGGEIDGEIVMNTASFVAVNDGYDTWAIDWRLFHPQKGR